MTARNYSNVCSHCEPQSNMGAPIYGCLCKCHETTNTATLREEIENLRVPYIVKNIRADTVGKPYFQLSAITVDLILAIFTTHQKALLDRVQGELPKESNISKAYSTSELDRYAYNFAYNSALEEVTQTITKIKGEL